MSALRLGFITVCGWGGGRFQDDADVGAGAVGGVGCGGVLLELLERCAGLGEFGEAPLDLGEMLVNQVGDVPALTRLTGGRLAALNLGSSALAR